MTDMPGLLRAYLALEKKRKAGGLSPSEVARWSQLKSALNQHFEPNVDERHAQKRASVRVPTSVNVSFESRGAVSRCMMKNLSEGGIFVATESPLEIGTPFNVRIRIERTGEEVELPGEVVSVGVSANLAREQHGMGIRFVGLSDAQRKLVAEFTEEALKKAIDAAAPQPDEDEPA